MAGELEHIIPTSPGEGIPARRTRNINFVDTNGVLRSITHVYWSPTNNPNDVKLIWQRDHSPVGEKYTNLNNTYPVLFEWTCPDGTTSITSLLVYVDNAYSGTGLNKVCTIWIKDNNELKPVYKIENNGTWSLTNETLNVDDVDTICRKVLITNIQNVNVSPGTTYYIYLNCNYYQTHNHNIAYPNTSKNAINYSGQEWKLFNDSNNIENNEFSETTMNNLKAEVNGVQI